MSSPRSAPNRLRRQALAHLLQGLRQHRRPLTQRIAGRERLSVRNSDASRVGGISCLAIGTAMPACAKAPRTAAVKASKACCTSGPLSLTSRLTMPASVLMSALVKS
jgi:hypothetical protein